MPLTGIFDGLSIATSGMRTQRARMNAIASNIANANTMESSDGTPYKRKDVSITSDPARQFSDIISTKLEKTITSSMHSSDTYSGEKYYDIGKGAKVKSIKSADDFITVYDPSSPYADSEGYVKKPNINPIDEMVKMMEAQRAFEANATSFNSIKAMMKKSLEIV